MSSRDTWTPLYASIAWAGGRALRQADGRQRRGTVLLDISNAELIRRTAHIDPGAAQALVPYARWCAFATALNADIARRKGTSPLTSPQSHPAKRPLRPARGNCG